MSFVSGRFSYYRQELKLLLISISQSIIYNLLSIIYYLLSIIYYLLSII